MATNPAGGGGYQPPPPITPVGGGGPNRPRNPWPWNVLQSTLGFLWRYMRFILIAIAILIGAPLLWNATTHLGASFKKDTTLPTPLPQEVKEGNKGADQASTSVGQETPKYDPDSESDESELDYVVAGGSTPAPEKTLAPTPAPTPTSRPTPVPNKKTPAPTPVAFVQDPDKENSASEDEPEEAPVQKEKKDPEVKKSPITTLAPKKRMKAVVVPELPRLPSSRQVEAPAPMEKAETAVTEPRKPQKLSKEKLERIIQQEIRKIKEGE